MKLDVSEIKKNTILEIDGQLFKVVDFSFMQMQQRQGSYSFKMKNLITGGVQAFTYKSGTVLEKGDVITKNAIFLYTAWDSYTFMENDTGEMYDLNRDMVDDIVGYLKENMDCFIMVYKENVISVILPPTVSYKIASTVPGVKWDRAQAGKKPATIETGMEIMIPLHKNEGDTVTLNTLTWETN
jgi:elongation factor P